MKIYVSTSNKDKLKEILAKLGNQYELISKDQAGYGDKDIEETGTTLEANAYLKARFLYDLVKAPVFADDSGLFVKALNGKPGVYTSRFAGEDCTYEDNVNKMLEVMKPYDQMSDRKAYFETVICFIDKDGKVTYLHGRMDGYIAKNIMGSGGFGYDPIFIPEGYMKSFAQVGLEVKNSISHRAKALDKLREFLGGKKWKLF